jgi:hypothetical protein
MTRDEAVKIWTETLHPKNGPKWSSEEWGAKAIEAYIALGMLKVDEPKDPPVKVFAEMTGGYLSKESAISLMAQMEERGLRVVFA